MTKPKVVKAVNLLLKKRKIWKIEAYGCRGKWQVTTGHYKDFKVFTTFNQVTRFLEGR